MAGSNDSAGGWQIATFVMLLPLGLAGFGAYSGFKQAADYEAARDVAASSAQTAEQNLRSLETGVQALKDLVGTPGTNEIQGAPTAVVEQLAAAKSSNAGAQDQSTVIATFEAMNAEVKRLESEIASLEQNLAARDTRLRSIEGAYQNRVDEADRSRQSSEQELQQKIREMEDRIAAKDEEIRRWRGDYENAQIQIGELGDELDTVRTDKDRQIKNLAQQVKALGNEVRNIRNVSFEKSDGQIVSVDAVQGICTINLGSLDGLRDQTTFSVYKKNNAGIGRGLEDIKGSIEVLRILGPHQAEARILDQDLYNPIAKTDPIFSPLWQEGQVEQFVFVGNMDINRDGTDDSELLRRLVENAGGSVEFYVDSKGARVPDTGAVDEKTKFVILGDLPNPADYPTTEPEYNEAKEVLKVKAEVDDEALQYGKRVVSLPDFLSYIGYKPTQRSYRPGTGTEYLLKSGSN